MKYLVLLIAFLVPNLGASQINDLGALSLQVIDPSLILLSASYGSGDNVADVTDTVVDLLKDEENHYANPGDLKADPSPGWNKELIITYLYNGSRFMIYEGENGRFSLGLLKSFAEKKGQPDGAATP